MSRVGRSRSTVARLRAVQRRGGTRGVFAVEFALVVVLLMFLLLGMMDYGFYFYVQHVVTTAAREGARAGALWPVPSGGDTNSTIDACASVVDATTKGGLTGVITSGRCGTTCGAAPMACVRHVTALGQPAVEVEVRVPVGSKTGFLPSSLIPAQARATAVMRRE